MHMLAQTPPMGWNSWNTFGWEISDDLIRGIADAWAMQGLLDAGYRYLVIDDCWSEKKRDDKGRLVPDHNKFPNGMKARTRKVGRPTAWSSGITVMLRFT